MSNLTYAVLLMVCLGSYGLFCGLWWHLMDLWFRWLWRRHGFDPDELDDEETHGLLQPVEDRRRPG